MAKFSVISTLTHRAKTVCTKSELFNQEIQHFREAITKCKYHKWALDKIERKFTSNNHEEGNEGNNQSGQSKNCNDNNSRDPEGRDTTKGRYTKDT